MCHHPRLLSRDGINATFHPFKLKQIVHYFMVIWDGIFPGEGPSDDPHIHESFSFESVSFPAARPLEFPAPTVHRGARCSTVALDHRTGRIHPIKNVLMRVSETPPTGILDQENTFALCVRSRSIVCDSQAAPECSQEGTAKW